MTVKEAEHEAKFVTYKVTIVQEIQYRTLQNLFSRILKRSYNHNTTFICRRLDELELSWSAVAYLLRVLRKARRNARFHAPAHSTISPNIDRLFQNLLLMQSSYCLVECGQVHYQPRTYNKVSQ